jgi:ankyrin repeat protein
LLLENKANPNIQNGNGATALSFAATFGHLSLVKVLLQAGANKQLQDRFGNTPLKNALMQENTEIAELLK